MTRTHVRLNLVTDAEERFKGVITCSCGIVSSGDSARGLQESVYIPERANAFSDIYQAVRA